ncbi:hypothetical protein KI387_012652, partial [Taxus chinensis]
VIMLLDAKNFPILFNFTKVYKINVLNSAYMPNTNFTDNYKTETYQNASEETRNKIKTLYYEVLKMIHPQILPKFTRNFNEIYVEVEKELEKEWK